MDYKQEYLLLKYILLILILLLHTYDIIIVPFFLSRSKQYLVTKVTPEQLWHHHTSGIFLKILLISFDFL